MKVNFTLEAEESHKIRQMLEDIPIDLCDYVKCPDVLNGNCDACPFLAIAENWSKGAELLCLQTIEALKKLGG